jgi:hypothetical protein
MLGGSTEDNVLCGLCWNENLAPQIIERGVKPTDFSTQVYRRIAQVAIEFNTSHRRPPRMHLADILEVDIKRGNDGAFIQEILNEMEHRLAPNLNEQFVLDSLDGFLTAQTMLVAVNAASDFLTHGQIEDARNELWKAINAGPPPTKLRDPWSDPVPPPFDPAVLPRAMHELKDFVIERAETTGMDPLGYLWAALSTCSAALDGSIRLQMKEHDPHYTVPPGIWVLLFGEASTGRTPILQRCWDPLEFRQKAAFAEHKEALAKWNKEDADERGEKPTLSRYIVKDVTVQRVQDILTQQDRGVARFVDEWAFILGQMMAYTNDKGIMERAFYLQSYDGGQFLVDRVGQQGRGQGYMGVINNNHIVHCGGAQPDRLRSLAKWINLVEDGLIQRFNPFILRLMHLGVDQPIGRQVLKYEGLVKHLTTIKGGGTVRLDDDARRIREDLEALVFDLGQNRKLGMGYASYVRKLPRLWGSLTLQLGHIIAPPCPEFIGGEAAELADYLVREVALPHGTLFYEWLGGGGDLEFTQMICGFLLSEPRAKVVMSDLTNHVRRCRGMGLREVQEAMSPVCALGWTEPEGSPKGNKWIVNPAIYNGQFQELIERERRQRRQIHQIITGGAARTASQTTSVTAQEKVQDSSSVFTSVTSPAEVQSNTSVTAPEQVQDRFQDGRCANDDDDGYDPEYEQARVAMEEMREKLWRG